MAAGDVSYAKARVLVPCLTEANVDELHRDRRDNPGGSTRCSDRRMVTTQRRPRRHQSPSTRGAFDVVAHRSRRDDRGDSPLHPRGRRRGTAPRSTPRSPRSNAPAGASLARQRADATATIVITGGGGGNMTGGGRRSRPRRRQHPHRRHPLSDHAVTQMLPTSFISLLIHDAKRQPIDASPRRRFPTRRQARVIDERHHECAHPGCTARHFLQHDHIQPFPQGGPTVLDNLQRLCGPHNRAKNPRRAV